MASKLYVGLRNGLREIFRNGTEPTAESHGDKYAAVIGPFRTLTGALAMVHFGAGNPHIQCVADAERIGRKYKDRLRGRARSFNPYQETTVAA